MPAIFTPNPYYPTYMPAAPQMAPQMQTVPQPQTSYQQPINTSGMIWVGGEQEVQMYPIAPNNAVPLWDRSGKTVYIKSADATGRPSVLTYDLTERKITASGATSAANGETTPAWAKKAELDKLAGVVSGFGEVITKLSRELKELKEANGNDDE